MTGSAQEPDYCEYYFYDKPEDPDLFTLEGYGVYYWQPNGQVSDNSLISGIGVDEDYLLNQTGSRTITQTATSTSEDLLNAAIRTLLPADVQFLSRESSGRNTISYIETYHSKSLETRYSSPSGVGQPEYASYSGNIQVIFSALDSGIFINAELPETPPCQTPTPVTPTSTAQPVVVPTGIPTAYVPPQPVQTPP
ncbi:MAG: hypothetical protein ABIQ44_13285 [Chloroflexia bacterium]